MEELDLKGLFNVFWKGKVKIILIVLIMIVLGVIYTTSFVTEKYTASTTLVLATSGNKSQAEGDAQAEESITATEISVNSKLVFHLYTNSMTQMNGLMKIAGLKLIPD